MRTRRAALVVFLLSTGCIRYHPRPIDVDRSLEDFEARRLDAPELGVFLRSRLEVAAWPPPAWDLYHLTLAAFYYSPVLDVARARWGVARGGVVTAGARPNPSATVAVGYNATTDRDEVRPWIPEGVLDLPLEVAGRRGIRIREARQRSESARLDVLSSAWEVRSRVRRAFLALYVAREADSLLARQRDLQSAAARILEARLAVGEASPNEVTRAHIALADSRVAALAAAREAARARSELADATGVPPSAVDSVTLDFGELARVRTVVPPAQARRRALVRRSDIRSALAAYEARQAALQLEIRKQYPDISLGPGYQLDQTDTKWTLGLSVSLPLLNHNRGPIAEAAARREEAAASFLALQSRVLGQVEASVSVAGSAVEQVQAADTLLAALERRRAQAQVAYDLGEISRLELLGVQSELVSTALVRLDALEGAQQALGELEDAMQVPLNVDPWVLEAPERAGAKGGGA
jgi:outer membrane protein TolC